VFFNKDLDVFNNKSWVSLKLRMIIKILNEIVPNENRKGGNSNFFFNQRLFELFPIYLCYGIHKVIHGITQSLPKGLVKDFLS
jgi:hypothetical protein